MVAEHARSARRAVERTGFLKVIDQMPRRQEPTTLRLMPDGAVDRQVNRALAVARRGELARVYGVRGEHAVVGASAPPPEAVAVVSQAALFAVAVAQSVLVPPVLTAQVPVTGLAAVQAVLDADAAAQLALVPPVLTAQVADGTPFW